MATTKKKKLIWQIPLLLIVGLTAIELWNPGAVMGLPLVRDLKAHWYGMRLGNNDPKIQRSAAEALAAMGPKAEGAVPALIATLDSSDSEVRDAAAWALGEIGPDAEAAVPSLIHLQERDRRVPKGDRVKLNASVALRKIGEPGLVPLITGLQDKDPSVRKQSADFLGFILLDGREPKLAQKAMQPLIDALQDEDLGVRQAAAMAMQGVVPAVRDPEARATIAKALIRAMQDKAVVPYALGALIKIAEAGLTEDVSNALRSAGIDPDLLPKRKRSDDGGL